MISSTTRQKLLDALEAEKLKAREVIGWVRADHENITRRIMALTIQELDTMVERSARAAINIAHHVDCGFREAEREYV